MSSTAVVLRNFEPPQTTQALALPEFTSVHFLQAHSSSPDGDSAKNKFLFLSTNFEN